MYIARRTLTSSADHLNMGCEKVSEEEWGFSWIKKVNGTFREEI